MSIFKKIFSIEEKKKTHNKVTILGLSFSYQKRELVKSRKKLKFYDYKKEKMDITKLPKAEGLLRDIQLANLGILKWFDKFCKDNQLEYFLFAGSALGQVRHKGIIPWDDDIDLGMLRDDYEKVLVLLDKDKDYPVYAEHFSGQNNDGFIIKIKHRKSDKFFVDIFALDYTGKSISIEEQKAFTKEIKENRKQISKLKKESKLDDLLNMRDKYIDYNAQQENTDILLGVEWGHSEPNWFLRYDTVYPIKDVVFEDITFKSMAKPEQYLSDYYGNYMDYPKNITFGHSMFDKFEDEDYEVMNELKGLLK